MQAKRAGRPAEISLHSQIYAKAFYSRYVGIGTPLVVCPAPFLTQRLIILSMLAPYFLILPNIDIVPLFLDTSISHRHICLSSEGYISEGPGTFAYTLIVTARTSDLD